jgi:hypothetical protein
MDCVVTYLILEAGLLPIQRQLPENRQSKITAITADCFRSHSQSRHRRQGIEL